MVQDILNLQLCTLGGTADGGGEPKRVMIGGVKPPLGSAA